MPQESVKRCVGDVAVYYIQYKTDSRIRCESGIEFRLNCPRPHRITAMNHSSAYYSLINPLICWRDAHKRCGALFQAGGVVVVVNSRVIDLTVNFLFCCKTFGFVWAVSECHGEEKLRGSVVIN